MRAIQVAKLDGPAAVRLVEIDEPAASDGMVIVDVEAAGVSFPDVLLSRGLYQYKPELPFVPGSEIAGVVRAAPPGAPVNVGDRVAGLTSFVGGMAEVAAVSPGMVFQLPDNVSTEAGAGLLLNDLTAHCALHTRGGLRPGETVLVHGGAGGLGTSTLRMAAALGAGRTIAVVSTEDKEQTAIAAGASAVVRTDSWLAAVDEITGGQGVDIVLDPVGGDRFTDSIRSLRPGGRLLVLGFTAGEIPTVKVNRLLLRNVDVRGVWWGGWLMKHGGHYLAQQWCELQPLLASGVLSPPDPVPYPLERGGEAIASLENRTAQGKVILTMR